MAGATEYARMAGVAKHLGIAGATVFVDAAGYAVPIGTIGVTRYAVWSSPAGQRHQQGFRPGWANICLIKFGMLRCFSFAHFGLTFANPAICSSSPPAHHSTL